MWRRKQNEASRAKRRLFPVLEWPCLPSFWLLFYKWRAVIKRDIGIIDLSLSQMQIVYSARARPKIIFMR